MENANDRTRASISEKPSFAHSEPLRNIASWLLKRLRRVSAQDARFVWIVLGFVSCVALEHSFEQQQYAELSARMDKFRDISPNGCERKWDGIDYYFICTAK